jgi:hypothetical protein
MHSGESLLIPKHYILKYTLQTEDEEFDQEKVLAAHNLSYELIDFFVTGVLNNSAVVDVETIDIADEFISQYFENNIVVTPGFGEGMLIACLHTKLNTIIDDMSTVVTLSLHDDDGELSHILTIEDEGVNILPNHEDWMGEFPFWKTSWWNDTNSRTYDNYNVTKKDQTAWNRRKKKDKIDELLSVPFEIIKGNIEEQTAVEKDGEVIDLASRKKWKPEVV